MHRKTFIFCFLVVFVSDCYCVTRNPIFRFILFWMIPISMVLENAQENMKIFFLIFLEVLLPFWRNITSWSHLKSHLSNLRGINGDIKNQTDVGKGYENSLLRNIWIKFIWVHFHVKIFEFTLSRLWYCSYAGRYTLYNLGWNPCILQKFQKTV